MKSFLATSLQNFTIPYWCSSYFCGSPFISDIQSGVFYPLSLTFMLLPFPLSFNIYIALHLFIGFYFFYKFITGLGLSKGPAVITSISYCFGGYIISSINTLNNLSTAVWLPAILWAFIYALEKSKQSGYFLTVIFLVMAILGGEPQLFLMISVALLVICLLHESIEDIFTRKTIKKLLIILLLILASILITIIQLGPTYLDYGLSVRAGGIGFSEAAKNSLSFGMLKHLIIPIHFPPDFATDTSSLRNLFPGNGNVPWLITVYPGMLIVPMAILGLISRRSPKTWLWFLILAVSIILALGGKTPFFGFFYKIIPFFRFPDKFIFLSSFSLLVLAAYGLDKLDSLFKKKSKQQVVFILLVLFIGTDLYYSHKNLNPLCEITFYQQYHKDLQPILDDPEMFRVYIDESNINSGDKNNSIMGIHSKWQMLSTPNLGILNEIDNIGGTSGLELRYQYIITELLLRPWEDKIRFLRLANVKYIISHVDLNAIPQLKGKIEKINSIVYRINNPIPRAWVVGHAIPISRGSVEELFNESFDPAYSVITNKGTQNKYNDQFHKTVDDINYSKPGKIQIRINLKKPGILILTESSYPGWRVFVDGKERDCLWLNLLFQGVEIEKGSHAIEFLFKPRYMSMFVSMTLVSIFSFLFIWIYFIVSAKKSDS